MVTGKTKIYMKEFGYVGVDRAGLVRFTSGKFTDTFLRSPQNSGMPPYPWVISSKTYCSYVNPRIILNAIYIT
jgi:hypothetical protein